MSFGFAVPCPTGSCGLGGRRIRLRWELREGDWKGGVGPLVWDRSWSAEVVPLWGPCSQGCLTLTRPDGTAVDL
jgi:hypothetical protein